MGQSECCLCPDHAHLAGLQGQVGSRGQRSSEAVFTVRPLTVSIELMNITQKIHQFTVYYAFCLREKRSEKYSFYDYVDITIYTHFQPPHFFFVSPEIRNIFLSFCMVFGSSQRIDNIIFRLRSKGANELKTNSKCYAYRSKFLYMDMDMDTSSSDFLVNVH